VALTVIPSAAKDLAANVQRLSRAERPTTIQQDPSEYLRMTVEKPREYMTR